MDLTNKLDTETRQFKIHSKGFDIGTYAPREGLEYNKIKVGMKTVTDASINLGDIPRVSNCRISKRNVLQALADKDIPTLRFISDYFYRVSGIYQRACNYMA